MEGRLNVLPEGGRRVNVRLENLQVVCERFH